MNIISAKAEIGSSLWEVVKKTDEVILNEIISAGGTNGRWGKDHLRDIMGQFKISQHHSKMDATQHLLGKLITQLVTCGRIVVSNRHRYGIQIAQDATTTFSIIARNPELYKQLSSWYVKIANGNPSGANCSEYTNFLCKLMISLVPQEYGNKNISDIRRVSISDWEKDSVEGLVTPHVFMIGLYQISSLWCPSVAYTTTQKLSDVIKQSDDCLLFLKDIYESVFNNEDATREMSTSFPGKRFVKPLLPVVVKKKKKKLILGAPYKVLDDVKIYNDIGNDGFRSIQILQSRRAYATCEPPAGLPSGVKILSNIKNKRAEHTVVVVIYIHNVVFSAPRKKNIRITHPPRVSHIWLALPFKYTPHTHELTLRYSTTEVLADSVLRDALENHSPCEFELKSKKRKSSVVS